jgi:hypothetical protein
MNSTTIVSYIRKNERSSWVPAQSFIYQLSLILAVVKLLAEHTKSDLSSANSAILAVLTDKTGSDMANQRSIQNISSFQFQGSASQYYAISEDEVSQYGLSKYENIRSSF